MFKKLSNKTSSVERNDGDFTHGAIPQGIVRSAFRSTHYGDSSLNRVRKEASLMNHDFSAFRQAEALLRRTSMLR